MFEPRLILLVLVTSSWGSSTLHAFRQESVERIVEESEPMVVNVRAKLKPTNKERIVAVYESIPENNHYIETLQTVSVGSGFVLDGKGHIVTTHQAVAGSDYLEVVSHQREVIPATLLGSDPWSDLAVLKVKPSKSLRPIAFRQKDIGVTFPVVVIGNPFGYACEIIQSYLSVPKNLFGSGLFNAFGKLGGPVDRGTTGGAVLDDRGRIVGMVTGSRKEDHRDAYLVSNDIIKRVTADLIDFGRVKRMWLGIVGKNILSNHSATFAELPTNFRGVQVENIVLDSPSYQAGLEIGDLITSMNSTKIVDINSVREVIRKGERVVKLEIHRPSKGKKTLEIRPKPIPHSRELPPGVEIL